MTEELVRWVKDTATVHTATQDACHQTPIPAAPPLPAGLRVRAHAPEPDCPGWSYVRWDPPSWPLNSPWGYVETSRLTDSAPKVRWTGAAQGTVYADQAGENPLPAIPLDDPSWTAPLLLSEGEVLELLAPGVVRTTYGRVGFVDPRRVVTAPTNESDWQAIRGLLDRFHAGRTRWEKDHALAPLPASTDLAKAPTGSVYWFKLDPDWILERRYRPEWLDPVGATFTHACGKYQRVDEPCGTYALDFSPLGAWWPDNDTDVVATWDGNVLTVRVLEPWSRNLAVTPSWAE